MNETPKTKITIDDLVEAQQQTARSLKAIEEHLDAVARAEKIYEPNDSTITWFIVGCGTAAFGEMLQSALRYNEYKNARALKIPLRQEDVLEHVPLLIPFVMIFVGFHVIRYLSTKSAFQQKVIRLARKDYEKKVAADKTPPTSSW